MEFVEDVKPNVVSGVEKSDWALLYRQMVKDCHLLLIEPKQILIFYHSRLSHGLRHNGRFPLNSPRQYDLRWGFAAVGSDLLNLHSPCQFEAQLITAQCDTHCSIMLQFLLDNGLKLHRFNAKMNFQC